MRIMNSFTLKEKKYEVEYLPNESITIKESENDIIYFENRKDFFFFINQLTDAAEEIKDREE